MRRPALHLASAFALVLLSAAPADAGSVWKRCYLAVEGKVEVNGPCRVFPLGNHGYTLNVWSGGKPRRSHFANVNAAADGTGDASWNADPNDDRALDPLGKVRWARGCWVNRRAKICAR